MALDAIKRNFFAAVGWATDRLDYAGLQAARVAAQNADGTLEVQFEDSRYPPLSSLRLLPPAPGCTVKVSPGARVMVGWLGCNPDFPLAVGWDTGAATEINLTATTKISLSAPEVDLGDALQKVVRAGDAITGLTSATGGPVTGTIAIAGSTTKVKA